MAMAEGALAHLKIVEFAGLGPAPFAGMMLADHGADVLQIAAPGARNPLLSDGSAADVLSRKRRRVTLDLKTQSGHAEATRLIADADGLIEGFRPGVMERLRLGPEACHALNPRLVYGRMTGWGQTGPLAHKAGHDINYLALSGVLSAIGTEANPVVPLNVVGDFGGGGMLLAFGMLTALIAAQRTGRGQVVDAAIVDGVSLLAAMVHGLLAEGSWMEGRGKNALDGGHPTYGVYPCADGAFVAVGALERKFQQALFRGLGLADDTDLSEQSTWPSVKARVGRAFASRPRSHWLAMFAELDACITPVLTLTEAQRSAQARARDAFVSVAGVPQPRPAPRLTPLDASEPESGETH